MSDPFQEFRRIVEQPEEEIDLGRAALTIALDDYPDLDIPSYLERIDQLAMRVGERAGVKPEARRVLAELNHVLFEEQRFRPNRENYFDPKNSFLNEVLDRKTGIPITLSVLYMEIAGRAGLPLCGVSFPGHFLVKYAGASEEIVIDPFNGGEMKSRADLKKILDDQTGGNLRLQPALLEAAGKKQILKRMLNNLKAIYWRNGALTKALPVLERMVILDPTPEDVRDRGIVYFKLDCFRQAREDFARYLELLPDAADASEVREKLIELNRSPTELH